MDWSNERYVRVYTRDTTTWKLMDWRGRTVLSLLIRKVDRAGVLDVGHDGVLGLAAVLELPIEIAEAGIAQLTTARGGTPTVVDTGTAYVLPNFIEAQEAPQSDPQRKRESRARRRDVALAVSQKLLTAGESGPFGHETGRDRDGNADEVTPIRSDPILAIPESPPSAHAIPPAPVPAPPPPTPVAPPPAQTFATRDLAELRAIGDLALATWQRLSELRVSHASKLGLPGVLPFPVITPGRQPAAFDELRTRIREEGDNARAVCDHVLRVLDDQARESKSIDWLSEKAFLERPWSKARETVLGKRKAESKARSNPALQVSTLTPEQRIALAAEARSTLGIADGARAPPSSAAITDEQQPQPARTPA